MTAKDTTQIVLSVHRTEPSTRIVKQYGMRYPDGTVKWGTEDTGYGTVDFKALAHLDMNTRSAWDYRLKERAERANVNLHIYTDQHQPVTRQVVVAILEIEEV